VVPSGRCPPGPTLLSEFQAQPDDKKGEWLLINQTHALQAISKLRQDKNVLLYASAFL